jgi:enoyl-CoA hydratase/carnithine racemase
MSNSSVKMFRLQSGRQALEELTQALEGEQIPRVVVFIIQEATEIEDENLFEIIENFPVPIILALKNQASEKLVAACHLCVAAAGKAKIGRCSVRAAFERGLINKIADFSEVEAEAAALAEKIAPLAPLAIRACLKAVTEGARLPLEEGLRLESELFAQIFATEDMREGTRAFLEKRPPTFRGK